MSHGGNLAIHTRGCADLGSSLKIDFEKIVFSFFLFDQTVVQARTSKHLVLKHYQRMRKYFCTNYVRSKNNGVNECTLQLFCEELEVCSITSAFAHV